MSDIKVKRRTPVEVRVVEGRDGSLSVEVTGLPETRLCICCGKTWVTEKDKSLVMCPKCRNNYKTCPDCGQKVHLSQMQTANKGKLVVCYECFNSKYTSCMHCGEYFKYKQQSGEINNPLALPVPGNHYQSAEECLCSEHIHMYDNCAKCGGLHIKEKLKTITRKGYGNKLYCPSCHRNAATTVMQNPDIDEDDVVLVDKIKSKGSIEELKTLVTGNWEFSGAVSGMLWLRKELASLGMAPIEGLTILIGATETLSSREGDTYDLTVSNIGLNKTQHYLLEKYGYAGSGGFSNYTSNNYTHEIRFSKRVRTTEKGREFMLRLLQMFSVSVKTNN